MSFICLVIHFYFRMTNGWQTTIWRTIFKISNPRKPLFYGLSTTTILIFLPTSTWTRVIPSNFRTFISYRLMFFCLQGFFFVFRSLIMMCLSVDFFGVFTFLQFAHLLKFVDLACQIWSFHLLFQVLLSLAILSSPSQMLIIRMFFDLLL